MSARIIAIRYAHLDAARQDHFLFPQQSPAEPMPIDYYFWLILSDDRVVVVDAGFTPKTAERRGRTLTCDPIQVLGQLGVSPNDVDDVVLTHLHYDHTGFASEFTQARIWVQQKETQFWIGPPAAQRGFRELVEVGDLQFLVGGILDGTVRVIDGDFQLTDEVSLHLMGGHTPGTQVVRIATADGPVVLASDATHFYENFERVSPYAIIDSLPGTYSAYNRMASLAGDRRNVIPGHDPLVLERYPALTPELADNVIQISAAPGTVASHSDSG